MNNILTLNNSPFSIFTCNWEGVNKTSRDIVGAIWVYTHGDPSALECKFIYKHVSDQNDILLQED